MSCFFLSLQRNHNSGERSPRRRGLNTRQHAKQAQTRKRPTAAEPPLSIASSVVEATVIEKDMKVAVLLMLPRAYEYNAADYSFAFAFMVQRCLIIIVKVDCQRRALAPSVYYRYRDRLSARFISSQRRSSRSTTMAMPSSYLVSPPEVVSSMKCLTFRSARIVLPFSTPRYRTTRTTTCDPPFLPFVLIM